MSYKQSFRRELHLTPCELYLYHIRLQNPIHVGRHGISTNPRYIDLLFPFAGYEYARYIFLLYKSVLQCEPFSDPPS